MATKLTNVVTLDILSHFKSKLDEVFDTKVDKVQGKGLSANDFTNDLKTKLDGIAAGAQDNVIESISVNGTSQTITSKGVDITMPTKLTDLTNDGNFVTDASYVHTDNNLTNALLSKLNGIEDGAEANDIDTIKVNDVAQTVTGKAVDITVTEGTANGTIKVAGSDVAVHGLGTAAFADADDLGEDNVIETVKVNGTALTPDANKAVNVTVPTTVASLTDAANYALRSQLGTAATANTESAVADDSGLPTGAAVKAFVEGKGYQTATDVAGILSDGEYATETYVNTAIGNANHLQATEVATLPQTGQTNILYLVPDDGGKSNKDMYIWDAAGSKFVLVGNTEVDLTGYAQESQFSVATASQIQGLFA